MITAHLEVDKKARWLYAEKQRELGLSSGQWYVSSLPSLCLVLLVLFW